MYHYDQDVANGRRYVCVCGTVNVWKISVFSSQFFCESKTPLQIKVCLKIYLWTYLYRHIHLPSGTSVCDVLANV